MRKEARLYEKLPDNKVRCILCPHLCNIKDDFYGFCAVRKNKDGVLYTPDYGEIIARHIDPIEKKPLYHFLPGSLTYSIASRGCNLRCGFCQNWEISQASENNFNLKPHSMTPKEVVSEAKRNNCKSIAYTYTEPTVFFEYAYDTAKIAKEEGLYNIFVTNGYISKEAIKEIAPYLDAVNVDLKSSKDEFYKKICQGHLGPVLDTIRLMKELNIWVEVTTLIIPNENDGDEEFRDITSFIFSIDKDTPWHISRFHPDYEFMHCDMTAIQVLQRAADIGKKAGLSYIYLGNVGGASNTFCYKCKEVLIEREFFAVKENRIKESRCPFCNAYIKGFLG